MTRFPLLLTLLLATAAANGQDTADDSSLLRGPDVVDRDVPGVNSTFGDTEAPMRGRERPIRHDVFMEALASLTAPSVPAELRATADQQARVRDIDEAYKAEQRAYFRSNRDEYRELRALAAEARAIREQADEGVQPTPEQLAAVQRLRDLRAAGPQAEEAHARMWAVLSAPQQAYVRSRLDQAQPNEGMMQTDRRPEPAAAPSADIELDDRWKRLLQRIQSLPDAQQRRIYQRLEQHLRRLEETPDRREPPSMNDVDVPNTSS
ncbi:MAG: DUF2065 domain-containing protein [Planctomycetota bacterium]